MSDARPWPSLLREARLTLAAAGVASPDADAVELASAVLGVDPAEVHRLAILQTPATVESAERFTDLVAERARRVPLQHLTGRAYFRGLTLQVGPGVFVPRPETELVAGLAIDAARDAASAGGRAVVVDLCTGSGALALSVKAELPEADVYAVEISPEAHAWAERNRAALGLEVDLRLGDAITCFADLVATVDVVVSNPPYIPTGAEPIDPEVRDHDPHQALYGGSADGLALPRLIAARAASLLRQGGILIMEHADSQGESLPAALARSENWAAITDHPDLTGRPRATVAVRA